MVSPVCGLRPVRAARWARSKVKKPVMTTFSPLATEATTTSSRPASTDATSLEVEPVWAATAAMRSVLVMGTVSPSSLEATTMHDLNHPCVHLAPKRPQFRVIRALAMGVPGQCRRRVHPRHDPVWRGDEPADRLQRQNVLDHCPCH